MDPWKILGIPRTSKAKVVKTAYRKLCRKTHPDLNPGESDVAFKLVVWAYKKITEPEKAGECPVRKRPKAPPKKARAKKRKPTEEELMPDYAKVDPTLRYFDQELRYHILSKPKAESKRTPPRKHVRPKGRPIGLADLMQNEKTKDSSLYKKWAKKMKGKGNIPL